MSDLAERTVAVPTGARPLTRLSSPLSTSFIPPILLALVMMAYALFFGWLSLERYWSYEMHALDMGNMGQAAWNTIHGHPFYFTNMRLPYQIEAWNTTTRLSFHVEALFPVLSLVYFINPHPESLVVLQTVALTIGAIPVYLLARDVLRGAWIALVFAVVYLLFPTLEALNLYEFHPVSLATPLLLFAFLFLWRRQMAPFILCSLAAMGTKEEIGLVVAMFGLYAAVFMGRRRVGLSLAVAGAAWSLFATLVVERHFRQTGTVTYLHNRYGYLGHGLHGAIHTLTHDPSVILHVLFIWPKLVYLERLLAPGGYLGLLAPASLLLGAPTLILNLFSDDIHMYSALGDNSAELVAVMMIAAILGTCLLIRLLEVWLHPRRAYILAGVYLLAQALWNQHLNGFSPIGSAFARPAIGAHQHIEDAFVAMIPDSVPVATQDQLDPHLSSRHDLYLFLDTGRLPRGPQSAGYVLLDVPAPTYPLPSYQLYNAAQVLLRHGWGITAARDGIILIEKGRRGQRPPAAFYSYADASNVRIPVPLRARQGGMEILGYGRVATDLANHDIPNLAYTFYLRPTRHMTINVQPVVFETMGTDLIDCVREPLGLAWLPSSHWVPGHSYAVRMDPLETHWNVPGTARLWMELAPSSAVQDPTKLSCRQLWSRHTGLLSVGTLELSF